MKRLALYKTGTEQLKDCFRTATKQERWPQVPTEKEIEAEARKQCLRAFEPYTYGPYFDALRDEYRRKAREILEARERTDEYAVIVAEHKEEAK
jgi:hypothetical protein